MREIASFFHGRIFKDYYSFLKIFLKMNKSSVRCDMILYIMKKLFEKQELLKRSSVKKNRCF